MGFSGIGVWEIIVVLFVALLVLGPKRLPEAARTLGRTIRAIKKASSDFTSAVTRELDVTKEQSTQSPAREARVATPAKNTDLQAHNPQPDRNEQPLAADGSKHQDA